MSHTTKQDLEASLKKLLLEKAAGQDHDPGSDQRLRHQPYGFLLSFQRYLRSGGMVLSGGSRPKRSREKRHMPHGRRDLRQIFEAVLTKISRLS